MIGIKATTIMICTLLTVTGCVLLSPISGYHGLQEKPRDAQPLLLNPNNLLLTEKSCLIRFDIDSGARHTISCISEKRYGHHITNGTLLFSETRSGSSGDNGVEALDLRTGAIKWRYSPSRRLVLLNDIVGDSIVILTVGSYDCNPWRIVMYNAESMSEIWTMNVDSVGPPTILCTTNTLYYTELNRLHAVDLTNLSSRASTAVNECILDISQSTVGLLAATETSLLLINVWGGSTAVVRSGTAEYLLPISRFGDYFVEIKNHRAYLGSMLDPLMSIEVPVPGHFDMVADHIALLYPEDGIRFLNSPQKSRSTSELSPLVEIGFGGFDRLCNTSIGLIITDMNGVHHVLDLVSLNVSVLSS